MPEIENVALFDMDGTLCDFDLGLLGELKKLSSPNEPEVVLPIKDDAPDWLRARANLIRTPSSWWENLPRFQLGFDIWALAEELDYRRVILTQGPRKHPDAWSGKKRWIDANLGEDTDMIITRDKGLVYGKVLVDDFPGYVARWLEWRPRGLAIMPANEGNKTYSHPQVIRYNGENLEEVRSAMQEIKLRK